MRRTILMVLGVLAISASAWAQQGGATPPPPPPPLEPGASQADVDKALIAAPDATKAQATVIKWKPDFTYTTLRKGTNQVVCYDRSGMPGHPAFSVECTMLGNLDRAAQNLKIEAEGAVDRAKTNAALAEAEKNGTRAKPVYGSVWYHVEGASQAAARPHMTIAVPGATKATTGLPENAKEANGGVWIMNAGTTTAHLMTPGE